MREYELYVPLHDNEGHMIDGRKIAGLKRCLISQFGGFTHFPQEGEGQWETGGQIFRDQIVILRVLTGDDEKTAIWFQKLKRQLATAFGQRSFLITVRETKTV